MWYMLPCLPAPELRLFLRASCAWSAFGPEIRPMQLARMRRRTAHEDKIRNERNEEPWRKETQRWQADAEAAHRDGRGAPELQPWPQQAGRGREGQTPQSRRSTRGQARAGAGRGAEG